MATAFAQKRVHMLKSSMELVYSRSWSVHDSQSHNLSPISNYHETSFNSIGACEKSIITLLTLCAVVSCLLLLHNDNESIFCMFDLTVTATCSLPDSYLGDRCIRGIAKASIIQGTSQLKRKLITGHPFIRNSGKQFGWFHAARSSICLNKNENGVADGFW
jgi:hypothetical protein